MKHDPLWMTALLGLLFAGVLCDRALSQEEGSPFSIRVEANEVIVPVYVVYKDRETMVSKEESRCYLAETEKFLRLKPSEPYMPADCGQREVHGLSLDEFQLFEDGVGQKIRSLRTEFYPGVMVRDSSGNHWEQSLSPGGRWSHLDRSELPALSAGGVRFLFYRLAYSPGDSEPGKCHQITVTTKRRGARVYARSQYCNVAYSPSDRLKGTTLGEQLEQYANSMNQPTIPLLTESGLFHGRSPLTRLNLSIEFPPEALARKWARERLYATVAVLGELYKDGVIVERFSDLGCCDRDFSTRIGAYPEDILSLVERGAIPARYETQLDLSPGEYKLKIVLSDGSKFGRAEIPLSIDRYDDQQLALSSVVLCKRYLDAARAAKEAAAVNLAPQYVPLVSKGVQFEPAGDTLFRKGDPLIAYFEVYEPLLATDAKAKVQVRLKITNQQTGEIKTDTGFRPADSWVEPGNSTIHIAQTIARDQLPPGSYQLEVQASDSAGSATSWRTAKFSIE